MKSRIWIICICCVVVVAGLFILNPFQKSNQEDILAIVDDRVITVQDYKTRAEFTPRPFWCNKNTKEHKIVALNSMISEKMMAIEGEQRSQLKNREIFANTIKGIQEQYMREALYKEIAEDQVKIDSAEFKSAYHHAGLLYDVEFYRIMNDENAEKLAKRFESQPDSASMIFQMITVDGKTSPPIQQVKYSDPDHQAIHQALFGQTRKAGEVIGPLKLSANDHIVMRVRNVSYSPAMTESESADRINTVNEKLTRQKSGELWAEFTGKLMKGKKIEFNRETFLKVLDIYSIQSLPAEERAKVIEQRALDQNFNQDDLNLTGDILDRPFFDMDGKVWTVRDFRALLLSHPLVFRKQDFQPEEYPEQFKFAIADLMRDHYVNQEAYKRKIDKRPDVQRRTAVWRDAYLATEERDRAISDYKKRPDFDEKRMRGTYTYLDEYGDSLQAKYSDRIKINRQALEDIELTTIDMMALQPGVPYTQIVPAFPLMNIDKKLDYGKELITR